MDLGRLEASELSRMLLFSCSVTSNSLQPHGLQHTKLPYPSPTPGTCPNSCPVSQWCHPTILSFVAPFSFCLQSFPASGYFLISWLFALGGQNIGASASASVLPINIQCWFAGGQMCLITWGDSKFLFSLLASETETVTMPSAKTDVNRRQEAAELLASYMYSHHCHWRKCHYSLEEIRIIKQSDPQKTKLKMVTVKWQNPGPRRWLGSPNRSLMNKSGLGFGYTRHFFWSHSNCSHSVVTVSLVFSQYATEGRSWGWRK